ncbi:MAG: cysteine synthase family protein [Sediminibacterium sp.]|nr:cysteine synthase family protein [Sediminibacterium sp.]
MEKVSILKNLLPMFGNTPLVKVIFKYKGEVKTIYAKYESINFSGSIKDRIAFAIMKNAYKNNLIKPEQPIVEVTSGNTGIAFTALARALGHEVKIIMPDWLSKERYDIIELYGGKVEKVSAAQGGFIGALRIAERYAQQEHYFYPDQFSNQTNVHAHESSTGPEILIQLLKQNLKPELFVAGVGTGGTVMGVSNYLKKMGIPCLCHPLEPSNSPTMSTGGKKIGSHRIQGVSDEFIPEITKLDTLESIISVDDGDSIIMAQKLNKIGLSVGISSGANFIGTLKKMEELGKNTTAVTIFCDNSFKYLSTALCKEEPVKEGFISTDVELLEFSFIR